MKRTFSVFLALAAACLLGTATAHAQTGTPQSPYVITTAPYTITKPGYYLLGKNLSYASTGGNIIKISASNVTLDFNGFYIAGPGSITGQQTIGVYAYEQSNLTIKNGTVAYCRQGIVLTGNGGANTNGVGETIDNMHVTYCYYQGIDMEYCTASTINNCKVSQTGYSGASDAYAIYCYGAGETIQNNTVSAVTATRGIGVYAAVGFACQNKVANAKYGVVGGKYQDNLTYGCTIPFSNGNDAGGNN